MALGITCLFGQSPPSSPDRPWHGVGEPGLSGEARRAGGPTLVGAPDKIWDCPN